MEVWADNDGVVIVQNMRNGENVGYSAISFHVAIGFYISSFASVVYHFD